MRFALPIAVALVLVGCATTPRRPLVTHDETGSGGGFNSLPPLQLQFFGQSAPLVTGSLGVPAYASTISATSITLSAASGANAISLVRGAALNFGTKDLSENVNNEIATSGVLRAQSFSSTISSGFNALAVINNGGRIDYGAGASDYASSDGTTVTFAGPLKSAATQTRGTITLAAGTGTATVITGAVCTCTDTTAANVVKCAVSSTTLTATGTGTDVVAYLCF